MTLTTERLDELCGGAPTFTAACSVPGCFRRTQPVGPYYSQRTADSVLAVHDYLRHQATYPATPAQG